MEPRFVAGDVRAACPDCNGAITTFEMRSGGKEFGSIVVNRTHQYMDKSFTRLIYLFLRCASCGRAGLALVHAANEVRNGLMESFHPNATDMAPLPSATPDVITHEYREAELCASVEAYRGAAALLRSTLEKTLVANGYTKGSLHKKIDDAANDGLITSPRRRRAHDDVRVLGNDILHDQWQLVARETFEASHHYVQRIIEDFYDQRQEVVKLLVDAGRIPKA